MQASKRVVCAARSVSYKFVDRRRFLGERRIRSLTAEVPFIMQSARCASSKTAAPTASKGFRATLFPGDGIGPEISQAVMTIFEVRFSRCFATGKTTSHAKQF